MKDARAGSLEPRRSPPLVEIEHVTVRFGNTVALDDVSLALHEGEVHALMGENGAGKSTLMKVLAGAVRPSEGRLVIDGREVVFRSPADALLAGVSTVFQELSLLPNLTIAENMFLGREPRGRLGTPDRAAMERHTVEALAKLGLDLDPRRLVATLSIAERQFVEIAHGLSADARVIVLDEPTAALNAADVHVLEARIRALRDAGKAIVYISHRMEEIFSVCDVVSVLKDGRHVSTHPVAEITPRALIESMVGRDVTQLFPARRADADGGTLLEVDALRLVPDSTPISFSLRAGEIVGLAGLEGQGQQALVRSLVGAHPAVSGTAHMGTHRIAMPIASEGGIPRMRSLGVALIPEDRKEEGLFLDLSVHHNLAVCLHSSRPNHAIAKSHRGPIAAMIESLSVKTESARTAAGHLSGGNQQKLLLGRDLLCEVDVLLVEEPTRGVDVGAKSEIYRLLREFTGQGGAVVIVSRESLELIGLCDRLLVVHAHSVVRDMPTEGATEAAILDAALIGAARTHPDGSETSNDDARRAHV